MPIDRVFRNEMKAYVRETQGAKRVAAYQRALEKARTYIRAPENRAEVLAAARPLIAEMIRQRPDKWEQNDIDALCYRDAQLRAYLQAPQARDIGPAAVHVNTFMAELSIRYANAGYIGELIAEPFTVGKESNIFAYYDERATLNFPTNVVGPDDELPELNNSISKSHTYQTQQHGFVAYVTPREIANADVPLDPILDAQLDVMDGNAFRREKDTATFFLDTTHYDSTRVTAVNAGEEFDSAGGGNPNKQIQDLSKSVLRSRGMKKVMALSIDTFAVLSRHPALLYTNVYTKQGFLTIEDMRSLFLVDELYVSEAWEDSANSGQAENVTRMWGDFIFVAGMQQGAAQSLRSYQFAKRFRKGGVKNETLFVPFKGSEGKFYVRETYNEVLSSVAPLAGAVLTNALVA